MKLINRKLKVKSLRNPSNKQLRKKMMGLKIKPRAARSLILKIRVVKRMEIKVKKLKLMKSNC